MLIHKRLDDLRHMLVMGGRIGKPSSDILKDIIEDIKDLQSQLSKERQIREAAERVIKAFTDRDRIIMPMPHQLNYEEIVEALEEYQKLWEGDPNEPKPKGTIKATKN